jgi:TonB family protein
MSRRLTFVVLGITIFSQYTSFAATNVEDRDSEPLTASEKQVRALAIFASAPRDPIVARASRIGGAGVAILSVDVHTGLVKAAWMDRSTGEKLLDDAALAAFRPWRFKPGAVSKVRIPIRFRMHPKPWLINGDS